MAALPRLPALFPTALLGRTPLAAFTRMAETAGWPRWRLALDMAAVAIGPGRVSLADYVALRLYDPAFWDGDDRREVVGAGLGRAIARRANFRRDCLALAEDRLAASSYLAAHGLPTAPVLAIFRADLAAPGAKLLRTRGELRQFLEANAGQPLVARPAEGGGERTLFAGQPGLFGAEIDRMVDEAGDTPGVSWLFQPRPAPHPAIARQMGGRPAPVRLVTLCGDHGARVFRAFWRLGGPDDLIASLDLRSGAAVTLAPAGAPHRYQPAPAGFAVPDWPLLKATAAEGARLFSQFGLIGWDIVPTADGPVILGLDPAPDLTLHQLIDRRGVLEPELAAFVGERRRLAAAWRRAARR